MSSYVHGPGPDEVLLDYKDTAPWQRRFPHADERGSVIAIADSGGNAIGINRYDEYGNPHGGGITGRFGYTGQAWLPEIALQYSKARMYSPALGRFLQTDPIGTAGGINLYAYVLNDPVNFIDPWGWKAEDPGAVLPVNPDCPMVSICITAPRLSLPTFEVVNPADQLLTRALRENESSAGGIGSEGNKEDCHPLAEAFGTSAILLQGVSDLSNIGSDVAYATGAVNVGAALDVISGTFDGVSLLFDWGAGNDVKDRLKIAISKAVPGMSLGRGMRSVVKPSQSEKRIADRTIDAVTTSTARRCRL